MKRRRFQLGFRRGEGDKNSTFQTQFHICEHKLFTSEKELLMVVRLLFNFEKIRVFQ